jgi:hypothetical protein
MSKPLILVLCLLAPFAAQAADRDCHYQFRADVALDGDAVELRGDDGVYRLDGDRLFRDGDERKLDARQRAAVDEYRRGLQALVPDVSGIALDGAMLGLEAMTMSFAALSNDADDLRKYERRAEKLGEKIHARFNGRELLRGGVGAQLDDGIDDDIADLAEDYARDISGSVASLVFTALVHPGRIEARADTVERLVERRIEPKADALEARARPLCGRFAALDALEPVIGIDVIKADDDGHAHDRKSGFAFSF